MTRFPRALGSALAMSLVAAAALGAAPSRLRAQPAETAEARRLFEQGVEMADRQRWGEALAYFRQSWEIVERPSTLYNIGNALFRLGRMVEALRRFEEYVRRSDPRRDRQLREQAARAMAEARSSIATLVLEVSPPEASVSVDGSDYPEVGAHRELQVDPGERTIRATAEGHEPTTLSISVLPGARAERRIELVASAQAAPAGPAARTPPSRPRTSRAERRPLPPAPPEPEHRSGGIFSSPVFWIVAAGVVVVGAGVGVGVALASGGEPSRYGGTAGVVLENLGP